MRKVGNSQVLGSFFNSPQPLHKGESIIVIVSVCAVGYSRDSIIIKVHLHILCVNCLWAVSAYSVYKKKHSDIFVIGAGIMSLKMCSTSTQQIWHIPLSQIKLNRLVLHCSHKCDLFSIFSVELIEHIIMINKKIICVKTPYINVTFPTRSFNYIVRDNFSNWKKLMQQRLAPCVINWK